MRGWRKTRRPPPPPSPCITSAKCTQAGVRIWVCMCLWVGVRACKAGENKGVSKCLKKNNSRKTYMSGSDKWWQIVKKKKFLSLFGCWFLLITHCCQTQFRVKTSNPPPSSTPSTMDPSPLSKAHSSTTYEVTLSTCLHPFWFATQYVTFPFHPPPAEQDRTQSLINKKDLESSCQCTAEFHVFASKHRASWVCRGGLIFVSSPWLWCYLSKPVGPSRLQGGMVKVKGTLTVKSEGIRDTLWCPTKTHMNWLGGFFLTR